MQNGELRVIGTNVARASRASEALRAVYGVSLARPRGPKGASPQVLDIWRGLR